jgi:hypothetical protein
MSLSEIGTMLVFSNYSALLPILQKQWALTNGQAGPTEQQLSWHTQRHGAHVRIHHIAVHVGLWPANGDEANAC